MRNRASKLHTLLRREQIAQAALGLIASSGVHGLKMAAVAGEVELVPSAIYRHFSGKAELIGAVLDLIRDRMSGNIQAAVEDSPDAMARLRSLLMRHIRFMCENRGVLRVFMSEDIASIQPDGLGRMHAILRGYLNGVAGIALDGQRKGAIRGDIDPQTVSMMFLGMIQPAMILWHVSGGKFDVEKHARRAWELFSDAICAGGKEAKTVASERRVIKRTKKARSGS